jgi:NAD(P)-dependent dehydrogenase (short-subunit alcohol dehydrogenase family)
MRLENKVSIVTGGGQGIGKAVSLALAKEGSDVLVADIVPQKAKQVCGDIQGMGRKSIFVELDVSKQGQVEGMVKSAIGSFGRIDILANVAGIIKKAAIQDLSEQDWDEVIDVNLKGTFLCSQAVGREMIQRGGGSIVNIASMAGHMPELRGGAYSVSKAGVISLTKMMAIDWAKYQIRVNAVSPGTIRTPMTDNHYDTADLREKRAKTIPLNRFGEPEEVANCVVFLASDESSFVTGHSLVVDGGTLNSVFHLVSLLSA